MHSRPLVAFVALVAAAVAQDTITYSDIFAGGPYGAASTEPTNDPQRARFAEANLNPNVTRSFQFTPFHLDGVFNSGSNAIDESNVWTLRINVTDFAVPNARPAFPSEQPGYVDPHITNTVFELDWDGDDSFRSALNGSTRPVCIAMTTASFLPNVTSLFTDDNDSGDCEPILGAECVNAILASGSGLDSCSYDIWESLPECASTIGASRSYAEYGLSRVSTNINANYTANNASYADVGYEAIANGTDGQYGFSSRSTDADNATNTTIFDDEASRLYVMLVSVSPYQGQFGLWSHNALCMRASAARLDEGSEDSSGDEEDSGSSNGSGDGAAGSENENAASALMTSSRTGSVLAFAGMLGLFALL